MLHFVRALGIGLAVLVVTLTAGPAQEAKGSARQVLDLAAESEAGKDVTTKAVALRKLFPEVQHAMRMYNARKQGGIGFGAKGVRIERRLVDLGADGISAEVLKQEAGELVRVAHVNLVLAEVTRGYAPAKPFLGRGKKEWDRDVDAMKAGSRDLLRAVKDGDPRAVQSAVAKINKACDSCHDGAK